MQCRPLRWIDIGEACVQPFLRIIAKIPGQYIEYVCLLNYLGSLFDCFFKNGYFLHFVLTGIMSQSNLARMVEEIHDYVSVLLLLCPCNYVPFLLCLELCLEQRIMSEF